VEELSQGARDWFIRFFWMDPESEDLTRSGEEVAARGPWKLVARTGTGVGRHGMVAVGRDGKPFMAWVVTDQAEEHCLWLNQLTDYYLQHQVHSLTAGAPHMAHGASVTDEVSLHALADELEESGDSDRAEQVRNIAAQRHPRRKFHHPNRYFEVGDRVQLALVGHEGRRARREMLDVDLHMQGTVIDNGGYSFVDVAWDNGEEWRVEPRHLLLLESLPGEGPPPTTMTMSLKERRKFNQQDRQFEVGDFVQLIFDPVQLTGAFAPEELPVRGTVIAVNQWGGEGVSVEWEDEYRSIEDPGNLLLLASVSWQTVKERQKFNHQNRRFQVGDRVRLYYEDPGSIHYNHSEGVVVDVNIGLGDRISIAWDDGIRSAEYSRSLLLIGDYGWEE
jgi:hypothetical protein